MSSRSALPRLTFASGVVSLLNGLRYLAADRAARRLACVPGLVALGLWLVALYGGVHYLPELAARWLPALSDLGRGWSIVLAVVTFLVVAPLALLFAIWTTPLLCAPVMDRLVLLREQALGLPPRPSAGFLRELSCAVTSQLGALVLFGPLMLVLWLVSLLVPAAAPALSVAQFFVGAAWLALSLLDYPLSLRGLRFRQRLALFRHGFVAVFGFGVGCAVLFAIPLFGLWGLPVAVVAAAELAAVLES